MIVNPYRDRVRAISGCRVLEETLGLIGVEVRDPTEPDRRWTIENLYTPLKRRVGGIRAKVRDAKDCITFINQRDLEVVLGVARPGDYCKWLGEEYVEPSDPEWFGFCADEEDLRDDLYDRELALRMEHPVKIPRYIELTRRVHCLPGYDVEELWAMLDDRHPTRRTTPDSSFSNLHHRWSRIQQERLEWKRM